MTKKWSILQRTNRQPWLKWCIDPSTQKIEEKFVYLNITPKYQLESNDGYFVKFVNILRTTFHKTMLPIGYPDTVHPNYVKFNWWNFVQGVAGSASGVLSTQCLLVGLGLAASQPGGTIAVAATLNWILKDGIGNLGGILFVTKFGSKFDKEAKRYRFFSALSMNLATVIEIIVPLVPSLFLPLASVANTFKSISWMANSATRAQIQRHFTKLDNLGDLTGKAASLNTTACVVGTGLGVILSTVFLAASSDVNLAAFDLVTRCWVISAPLILICLWANYQSCRLGISPRLSLRKIDLVLRSLIPSIYHGKKINESALSELSRYILDPTSVGWKEEFLYLPWQEHSSVRINFEPNASVISRMFKEEHQLERLSEFYKQNKFIAIFDEKKPCIWFSDSSNSQDIISGIFIAYLALDMCSTQSITWDQALDKAVTFGTTLRPKLIEALHTKGWNLSDIDIDRMPILIGAVE